MTGPANRMALAAPSVAQSPDGLVPTADPSASGSSGSGRTPAAYSWEATDEQVAARYGVPLDRIARFDLNTLPEPPDLAARILTAGRFQTLLSEYPPSDYRRLAEAAARRYGVDSGEILVGAGADEILDMIGKAFLPPGGRAVVPTPSYAMYRVVTEQRTGTVVAVPRLGPDRGYAIDVAATRLAARTAALVWLCSPNNPTGLAEPHGAIESLLAGLAADADADGRTAPAVALDEAYAEFTGHSLLPLLADYPRLVVVRTLSKAWALAGLRVGFAIARRPTLVEIEPYRPPGSVSTVSVTLATEVLADATILDRNIARVETERRRLGAALAAVGWAVEPSVTNFILVGFGTRARCAAAADWLLRAGLVPRTFPESHLLGDHLRLTVRSTDQDDRLIAAAASFQSANAAETAR